MKRDILSVDVAVIGGGTGGLAVVSGLAYLGLSVVLIEKQDVIGGYNLTSGSIPRKYLMSVSNVLHNIYNANQFGINCDITSVSIPTLQKRLQKIIEKMQEEELSVLKKLNVKLLHGEARFISNKLLTVNKQQVLARKIVIATGGNTYIPKIAGIQNCKVYTGDNFFTDFHMLQDLVIIGDSYVALEYAQICLRFGIKATIITDVASFLPESDIDTYQCLINALFAEGVVCYFNMKVLEIKKNSATTKLIICSDPDGKLVSLETEDVLVATHMQPNISVLNLDSIGVAYNNKGIIVDKYFRTSQKHIYALGSIIYNTKDFSVNVTEQQANIIVNHISLKLSAFIQEQLVPRVVHTDPEFAYIGYNEQQAREKFSQVKVLVYEYKNNELALMLGNREGKIKLIIHDQRLVGASIVGSFASDIIVQFALPIILKLSITKILANILPYPNLSRSHYKVLNEYVLESKITKIMRKIVGLASHITLEI